MKKSEIYKLAITHLIDSAISTVDLVEVLDLLYKEKQMAELYEEAEAKE